MNHRQLYHQLQNDDPVENLKYLLNNNRVEYIGSQLLRIEMENYSMDIVFLLGLQYLNIPILTFLTELEYKYRDQFENDVKASIVAFNEKAEEHNLFDQNVEKVDHPDTDDFFNSLIRLRIPEGLIPEDYINPTRELLLSLYDKNHIQRNSYYDISYLIFDDYSKLKSTEKFQLFIKFRKDFEKIISDADDILNFRSKYSEEYLDSIINDPKILMKTGMSRSIAGTLYNPRTDRMIKLAEKARKQLLALNLKFPHKFYDIDIYL